MAIHSGRLEKDGRGVLDPVRAEVEEEGPCWCGTLAVPADFSAPVGETFRLVLDDGRAGDITVTGVSLATGAEPFVTFQGSGTLA